MLRGRNLATIRGIGSPMIGTIGEALDNACLVPETRIRAGKSLLKSFLFLSCLSYLLLPSAATPFHLPPYYLGRPTISLEKGMSLLFLDKTY